MVKKIIRVKSYQRFLNNQPHKMILHGKQNITLSKKNRQKKKTNKPKKKNHVKTTTYQTRYVHNKNKNGHKNHHYSKKNATKKNGPIKKTKTNGGLKYV